MPCLGIIQRFIAFRRRNCYRSSQDVTNNNCRSQEGVLRPRKGVHSTSVDLVIPSADQAPATADLRITSSENCGQSKRSVKMKEHLLSKSQVPLPEAVQKRLPFRDVNTIKNPGDVLVRVDMMGLTSIQSK